MGALVLYVLSATLYILNLYRPVRLGRPARDRRPPSSAPLCNFAALYARSVALHSVPYRDLLGSMKLFGFFLAVLNVVLELRHQDRSLGPFLMPAALVFMLLALLETPVAQGRRSAELQGPDLRAPRHAQHALVRRVRGGLRPLAALPRRSGAR